MMTGISMVFLVVFLVVKRYVQNQEKASRQGPRCQKTRKNPKSEEIEHSIAAR
jgi:hypothetical protein